MKIYTLIFQRFKWIVTLFPHRNLVILVNIFGNQWFSVEFASQLLNTTNMRNALLNLLTPLFFVSMLQAQFEVIGSKEHGRLFDVNYDVNIPNQLYAITLGNHIVSSKNNGEDWSVFYSVPNGVFNSAQNNLKTLQNDHLTFFIHAGLEARHRTVFVLNKFTKEVTHQYIAPQPDPQADNVWIHTYEILESDPDYALLSINYRIDFNVFGKVYLTQNGGQTWTEIYATSDHFNVFPEQVAFSPNQPEKIWITRGGGDSGVDGGLFLSEDSGQTWQEKLAGIILDPIAFHPENADEIWLGTGISFGGNPQNVYRSMDGGNTWNIVPFAWDDYILNNIKVIQFNPNNAAHLLILEENQVMISLDGGATWQMKFYENAADEMETYFYGSKASFNPFQENEIFVSANYYPFFSSDKGETMQRVKTPYAVTDGHVHYFSNGTEAHLYYGIQGGLGHINRQNGEETAYNVMPLNYFSNNEGGAIFIDPTQVGRVFTYSGGFMGSQLLVSENHGEAAQPIFSSYSNSLDNLKAVPGSNNKIWMSISSYGNDPELYSIDFSNIEAPVVDNISVPGTSGVVKEILFPNENPLHVVVAQGSRIYQTTDGGTIWQEMSQGLEMLDADEDMIFQLVQNPLNAAQLTLATNQGIFTSLDQGQHWTRLTEDIVHHLQHSTVKNGVMVATTHTSDASDFEMSCSLDFGTTWESVGDELFMPIMTAHAFSSTAIHFDGDWASVFVATTGLGLVQYDLDLKSLRTNEAISSKNKLTLYPNPTQDYFYLQDKLDIEKIEVYNASGRNVLSTDKSPVAVSHLPAGIYFIQITTQEKTKFSAKIIKK